MARLSIPANINEYFHNVLGVSSILLSPEHLLLKEELESQNVETPELVDDSQLSKAPKAVRDFNIISSEQNSWLVLVDSEAEELSSSEKDLLDKMLAAMKLKVEQISCISIHKDFKPGQNSQSIQDVFNKSLKILCLGEAALRFCCQYTKDFEAHKLSYHHNKQMIASLSLAKMLQDPNNKKITWNDMKKVLGL